jgi:hypothetical protein
MFEKSVKAFLKFREFVCLVERFPKIGSEFFLKTRFIDFRQPFPNRLLSHGSGHRLADGADAG